MLNIIYKSCQWFMSAVCRVKGIWLKLGVRYTVSKVYSGGRGSGYSNIENLEEYIYAEYGQGWVRSGSVSISGMSSFTQAELESNSNNCTLASIARIMQYYSKKGYRRIPSDINEIYSRVRAVGTAHGYDPQKTGIIRDLFVYTPWEIDNMVRETWKAFGYPEGDADNSYVCKSRRIRESLDAHQPVLINIASGYYKGHTACVAGYEVFSRSGSKNKLFVKIFDGWFAGLRYIDWGRFASTPASVTRVLPPLQE